MSFSLKVVLVFCNQKSKGRKPLFSYLLTLLGSFIGKLLSFVIRSAKSFSSPRKASNIQTEEMKNRRGSQGITFLFSPTKIWEEGRKEGRNQSFVCDVGKAERKEQVKEKIYEKS